MKEALDLGAVHKALLRRRQEGQTCEELAREIGVGQRTILKLMGRAWHAYIFQSGTRYKFRKWLQQLTPAEIFLERFKSGDDLMIAADQAGLSVAEAGIVLRKALKSQGGRG